MTVTLGFLFAPFEQLVEVCFLLVLCQDLETVVVVPYVLLVDAQHRQQHVEEICLSWRMRMRKSTMTMAMMMMMMMMMMTMMMMTVVAAAKSQ